MVFYTYLWLRDDGTPYYAGKGMGRRAFTSEGHCVSCPKDKTNILIQEWPDEAGAFVGERLLISIYGRKDLGTGCLRNRTDGGEGPSNPAESTRQKIRLAVGQRTVGKQYHLGHHHSSETKEKQRLGRLGYVSSAVSRARMSASASQRHARERAEKARSL